jgi:hypothetical protein
VASTGIETHQKHDTVSEGRKRDCNDLWPTRRKSKLRFWSPRRLPVIHRLFLRVCQFISFCVDKSIDLLTCSGMARCSPYLGSLPASGELPRDVPSTRDMSAEFRPWTEPSSHGRSRPGRRCTEPCIIIEEVLSHARARRNDIGLRVACYAAINPMPWQP